MVLAKKTTQHGPDFMFQPLFVPTVDSVCPGRPHFLCDKLKSSAVDRTSNEKGDLFPQPLCPTTSSFKEGNRSGGEALPLGYRCARWSASELARELLGGKGFCAQNSAIGCGY